MYKRTRKMLDEQKQRIAELEEQLQLAHHELGGERICHKRTMQALDEWKSRAEKARGDVGAAKSLCQIYFEIAGQAIGEAEVRRARDEALAAMRGEDN